MFHPWKSRAIFQDRRHAGKVLAVEFEAELATEEICGIVALPKGGIVTAEELSKKLELELHSLPVRKLGQPRNREWACGGLAIFDNHQEHYLWLDERVSDKDKGSAQDIEAIMRREKAEAMRRRDLFGTPTVSKGSTWLVVDDGIAMGATTYTAVKSLQLQGATKVHVAIPIARHSGVDLVAQLPNVQLHVHKIVPDAEFGAVGQWYVDFSDVSDTECMDILSRSKNGPQSTPSQESLDLKTFIQ